MQDLLCLLCCESYEMCIPLPALICQVDTLIFFSVALFLTLLFFSVALVLTLLFFFVALVLTLLFFSVALALILMERPVCAHLWGDCESKYITNPNECAQHFSTSVAGSKKVITIMTFTSVQQEQPIENELTIYIYAIANE